MNRIFLALIACVICFIPIIAQAMTHMRLDVNIQRDKGIILVKGDADQPVTLPDGSETSTPFSYSWKIPAPTDGQWTGGAFVSSSALYLPYNWHPVANDLITYEVTLTSKETSVIAGRVQDESQKPSAYRATFKMNQPVEGIPLFSGPYVISERDEGKVRLRTYFFEDAVDLAPTYLKRTARYIRRFSQDIGPFPFEQFNIIAAPVGAGYGFAGQTYMSARILRFPFILETSLGHEILHNYWGNGVFPDYHSGNWAEGLTTYMADYMTAEIASEDKARDMRLSWLRDFSGLPAEQDRPVVEFIAKHGQASQVIGYNKVAFIFHMLRRQLGDDTFTKVMRKFWKDYAFKTASWSDLEHSFSQVTGRDYSGFFKQWTTRSGAPEIKNISAETQKQKGTMWRTTLRVIQGEKAWKVNLPIDIGSDQGPEQKTPTLTGRISHPEFITATRPNAIAIDPDFHVFRRLSPSESPPILRDVMLATNTQLVVAPGSDALQESAGTLAQRMVEGSIKHHTGTRLPTAPFILVGLEEDVTAMLEKWHLRKPAMSETPASTATVWADQINPAQPYIVISVQDTSALTELIGPLPHYGRRSLLLFNGREAVVKKTASARPVTIPVH